MELDIFQVDAFIRKNSNLFSGNPAAVVPLKQWLPDNLMQAVAAENNLAETAFFTGTDGHYHIRWFTPTTEVGLCGHATLASAWVIRNLLGDNNAQLTFSTQETGELSVSENGAYLQLNFPNYNPVVPDNAAALTEKLEQALGQKIINIRAARDLMVELENEQAVKACKPDLIRLAEISDYFAVAVTAESETTGYDFVSRFFAPRQGIDEDPVTGSSFCMLAPYWQEKLGKNILQAWQCSPRGGDISLTSANDRVLIAGNCQLYLKGKIYLP